MRGGLGGCRWVMLALGDVWQWMTYRYAEMKVALSQLPLVNTVNPPVRRKIMHVANATTEVYAETV